MARTEKKGIGSLFKSVVRCIIMGGYYIVLWIILLMIKIRDCRDKLITKRPTREQEIDEMVKSKKAA